MFRIPSWISTIAVLLIGSFWMTYLCYIKDGSLSEDERDRLKQSLKDSSVATAQQARKKIRKDIWISQKDHQRLQNRLDSERSFLTLKPKKGSLELVEHLYDVECWSQEKFYTVNRAPLYQMRVLKAKEGTYKYQTQTFEALDAAVSLYKIPGISLITNLQNHQAFLQGTAEEISFAVESGVPSFQAHQFKASLSPGGRI